MTILTKASDLSKKPMIKPVVVDNGLDVELCGESPKPMFTMRILVWRPYCNWLLLVVTLLSAMLLLVGALMGVMYFNEVRYPAIPARYRGYCNVPLEAGPSAQYSSMVMGNPEKLVLRWSTEPEQGGRGLTLIQAGDQDLDVDLAANSLLERFDIDDDVEKISVYTNGDNIDFVHDFGTNTSGIMDKNRCFLMELDPEVVMQPHHIVQNIKRGVPFDVMQVMSQMRAVLPPALGAAHVRMINAFFADTCNDRPTYKLDRGVGDPIRKRDTAGHTHNYIHFAGNHVQEITIENMDEVLAYEASRKKKKFT